MRTQLRQVTRQLERYGQRVAELRTMRDTLRRIERDHLAPVRPRAQQKVSPPPIQVGDRVWVPALEREAHVVALHGNEAEVASGAFRLRVRVEELERRVEEKPTSPSLPTGVRLVRRRTTHRPPSELDLRGQTVEEALAALDEYLDQAYTAGLPSVRVIHGKGTGALRRAVREMLAHHPLVISFRPGDRYEGGNGATVVELARLS
ncbi:MAG: Smr/MutS family protein [Ardenticatenia bacterium]|nr:Smr/MutS family protein [Ardenticatenia bacterium]